MIEPKLKELLLQRAWLERARMEQEKRKRAITDSMASLGAQLEDRDAKAPLEAERVRQVNTEKEQQQQEESKRATTDFMANIDAQPEDIEAKALGESHAPAKFNIAHINPLSQPKGTQLQYRQASSSSCSSTPLCLAAVEATAGLPLEVPVSRRVFQRHHPLAVRTPPLTLSWHPSPCKWPR